MWRETREKLAWVGRHAPYFVTPSTALQHKRYLPKQGNRRGRSVRKVGNGELEGVGGASRASVKACRPLVQKPLKKRLRNWCVCRISCTGPSPLSWSLEANLHPHRPKCVRTFPPVSRDPLVQDGQSLAVVAQTPKPRNP